MKPGNLWFSNVKLAEFGSKLEIVGGADNNNTIAEFIKNLRSVSESDANDEDPRTWFTAENIQLDEVKRDSGGAFPGLEDLPQFALRFSSVDRVNSETEDSSK
jgi:hypothetical protein